MHISLSPHYRGYGSVGEEQTNGIADVKETYDFALEADAAVPATVPPSQKSVLPSPSPCCSTSPSSLHSSSLSNQPKYMKLIGPNQWPEEASVPAFRKIILEYIQRMRTLGLHIVRLFEMCLYLPEGALLRHFEDSSDSAYSLLRLLKYPPAAEGSQGVGRHVDQGCLVILLQDDIGGLEVELPNKKWITAPPIRDTFIVNIGSSLETWSDGYFVATPHRVMNPSMSAGTSRFSIPFFMEPSLTSVIVPFPLAQSLIEKEGGRELQKKKEDSPSSFVYGERMLMVFERSYADIPATHT